MPPPAVFDPNLKPTLHPAPETAGRALGSPREPSAALVAAMGRPRDSALLERLQALSAGGRRGPSLEWGAGGLPRHPSAEDLHYTLPPPPRVSEARDREDQLAFCLRWYQSAVRSRLGEAHPVRMGGETRKYFEDALEVFVEQEIRPGAWVAWALDRILLKLPTHARRKFHPQVKVLLSPKTLTESRWMFRQEAGAYVTAAWVKSTEGEALRGRMQQLFLAAQALGDGRTEERVRGLVAEHFPDGFEKARRAARENSEALGQEVQSRIALGHWLWPVPRELGER